MALIPGTKLGPYEIQSLLGASGMGEVYLARDTRLQRTVAIRVLPAHLSSDPELHARFEQEAKSISGLQHPNICVIHDDGCGKASRHPWLCPTSGALGYICSVGVAPSQCRSFQAC